MTKLFSSSRVLTMMILAGVCCLPVAFRAQEPSAEKKVTVRLIGPGGVLTNPVAVATVEKSDAEWRKQLTPEQYKIARGAGTEPAFCGTLLDNHREGIYHCVCCGLPLFTSDAKFNSGTGWPSFFQPIARENIVARDDDSYGMHRTEILCARCGAHLGHVFDDGPSPPGLRYCLTSAALTFVDKGREVAQTAK